MFGLGKNLLNGRAGSAMILVSIAMVSLIGFCSLVLDMGNLFLTKNRLNNALDASVLAACGKLPGSESDAIDEAKDYFQANGMELTSLKEVKVTKISENRMTVTASGQTKVEYFLARVLGISSSTVSCTAVAEINPVIAVKGVSPLGIEDQELFFGVNRMLKIPPKDDETHDDEIELGSGNFGILDLGGSGNALYEQYFKYGYDKEIAVGDVLETEPGVKSSGTEKGINFRVGGCTHDCTPDSYDPSCPRVIIIPVYTAEPWEGNKVTSVRIVGFAAFLLDKNEGYKKVGNESWITGCFLKMAVEGEGDEDAKDYGAYAVKLIV